MSDVLLHWRDHFATDHNLNSTQPDSFSLQGILVAVTSNPDVLALSIATVLPIWLENLPTSLALAADMQRDFPGIKVLYEDDPDNDGLIIRFVHEVFVTGMEDVSLMFLTVRDRLVGVHGRFQLEHSEL
jgi:hypothetical protein